MISRFILHRYFKRIGKLGGQARSRNLRAPFRETAKQIRRELNMGEHPGLRG